MSLTDPEPETDTGIDWGDLDTRTVAAIVAEGQGVLHQRTMAERTAGDIDKLIRQYAEQVGRDLTEGAPFVQPTGAHDAYPKDSIVTHDGKTWRATRAGANGVPGESPDWWLIPEGGEIPAWTQPHAGTEYELGALVTHNGHVWENEHDLNGWEPGTPHSQWKDLGPVEDYDQ